MTKRWFQIYSNEGIAVLLYIKNGVQMMTGSFFGFGVSDSLLDRHLKAWVFTANVCGVRLKKKHRSFALHRCNVQDNALVWNFHFCVQQCARNV